MSEQYEFNFDADCNKCEGEGFVLVHKTKEIVRCPRCSENVENRLSVPASYALKRKIEIE